jgi:hypothetical protein
LAQKIEVIAVEEGVLRESAVVHEGFLLERVSFWQARRIGILPVSLKGKAFAVWQTAKALLKNI